MSQDYDLGRCLQVNSAFGGQQCWINLGQFLDRRFRRAVKFEPNQGHPARNWIGLTGDVASVIHDRGIGPRLA